MRPSYNIYSLLNITSCTHHEQTTRIHVGNLFATLFTSVQCTDMCRQALLQERYQVQETVRSLFYPQQRTTEKSSVTLLTVTKKIN